MRRLGWESALSEYLANPPVFAWGENDCALWCADWVYRITGDDFASTWRGKYTTEAELNQLLLETGYRSAEDIASDLAPEMHPAFAQRGDIVMHPKGPLGICDGLWSHFLTAKGVTRIKTTDCPKAWAVR